MQFNFHNLRTRGGGNFSIQKSFISLCITLLPNAYKKEQETGEL